MSPKYMSHTEPNSTSSQSEESRRSSFVRIRSSNNLRTRLSRRQTSSQANNATNSSNKSARKVQAKIKKKTLEEESDTILKTYRKFIEEESDILNKWISLKQKRNLIAEQAEQMHKQRLKELSDKLNNEIQLRLKMESRVQELQIKLNELKNSKLQTYTCENNGKIKNDFKTK